MQFLSILGQESLKGNLAAMVAENKVSHAIMFSEQSGSGALAIAIAFAQYLSCSNRAGWDSCATCPVCNRIGKLIHPDLHFSFPVNTTSSVSEKPVSDLFLSQWRELFLKNPWFSEQLWYEAIGLESKKGIINVHEASAISRKMSLKSFEGGNKYLIMWLPERMNREASNKLLKLIEEPEADTYLLFISHAPELVIPTILSRCQHIRVPPIEGAILAKRLSEEYKLDMGDAEIWAKMAGGSLQRARELIASSIKKSESDSLIFDLLKSAIDKEFTKAISIAEEFSSMNKDAQRMLCIRMTEILRALYMLSLGQYGISNISAQDIDLYEGLKNRINVSFYEIALSIVNEALRDMDRNVNSKYIFSDIVNHIYLSV